MKRREFLRLTTAATLAVAAVPAHANSASSGFVDVNVSLGRWPTRRLPLDEPAKLASKLRKHGVTRAWAGHFDAAFQKDPSSANTRLAAECRKHRGLFVPFGTVNLQLPGWENELERCATELRMPGLRLFPNYHGYKFNTPAFAKLLALAIEKNLIIQIAALLQDERTQSAGTRVPHVDATPLFGVLADLPRARVMLLNWHRPVKPDNVKRLAQTGVCFDIATVENVGGVASLAENISADRVVFGSHAPFFYFEAALLKLDEAALAKERKAKICALNARRWLA